MFFRSLLGRIFLISAFALLITLPVPAQDESNYYAVVTNIKSADGKPLLYIANESKELNIGDRISSRSTVITSEKQSIEFVIFKNGVESGIITVKENTDFRFLYNNLKKILEIRIIYGGIRGVVNFDAPVIITSETVKAGVTKADFGIFSLVNEKKKRSGYSIVFGGELLFTSLKDEKNQEKVTALNICEFEDYKVYPVRTYNYYEFLDWKTSMLYQSKGIPQNLNLILEKLELKKSDPSTDVIEKTVTIKDPDYYYLVGSLFSFTGGILSYDNQIAIKLVYTPRASFKNDQIEFGFYFPLYLIPSKAFTGEGILKINNDNNEWSFGLDKSTINEKVFDIFDDILLKINMIRYNHFGSSFFVQYGEYNNLSDYLKFSLNDFNSYIFSPKIRKSSLISSFNLDWFDGFVFAEEILPKGIYGANLVFRTPAKSFRANFILSGYFDCFDLIKFNDDESVMPLQANTGFNFDSFNVPSFRFSIFLMAGIYLPFTYNFKNTTSSFMELLNTNPMSILASTSISTGLLVRIQNFSVTGEFIFDSGLNKVGLFDTIYMAKRVTLRNKALNWISDLNARAITIDDFNFGFRFCLNFSFLKHVTFETSYQATFPKYYDKMYVKLILDSAGKWKFNVSFFLQWHVENLGTSFLSVKAFQENHLIYAGLILKPHKNIDINISGGISPDFVNFSAPWYSSLTFDIYINMKNFYFPRDKLKMELSDTEKPYLTGEKASNF